MGPWWWPLLWCFHAALVHGTTLAGSQRPQERPPQPAGWSPAPSSSWSPTPEPGASGDPEGSAAALAFLQTGDAQRLARVNCSRDVAVGAPGPGPPPALRVALRAAPEALAHAANFLNMLFQTNDIREASVAEDVEWYQALVRSLAEGHPWVRRAVLALDAHPLAAKPRLMLQATKGDSEILLQDVSAAAPSLGNLSWDNEWFNALKSQRNPLLRKRLLSNDLRSMETPKWQRGDSYVGEPGHVRWSPPFLECQDGKFLPAWVVTLSSAFYGLKPDLSPEFKGVVRVDIELRDVAIDQCSSGPGWFADTHRCDLNSTQCVPQESRGFVLGRYLCRCKPGFYGAGGVASGARAGAAGNAAGEDGGSRLACRPCRQGCATCEDDAPCLIQEDRALRAAVLSCQACCMLAVFLSMLISYHFRHSKRIRASGVVLLETILFGSLLLYFPVFILYFKPSIFRCIVLRWVRMLGFAIVYGTITLKLYRVLKVFLSRTAQRVPYVSSGRVLKMLGLILLLVLWFLAAWTIGMLENVDKNIPLVIRTQTTHGLYFYICSHDRWDYMMVIAEMLFLLWGSFLCYATRAVPSAFHEPRYMGIALHNELMISATFHVVRFIMVPSLHPDWTLLLFFAHTHGTITMTLALLFIPKFLHAGSPLREEIAAEVYEDELDMRHSGSCLNSSIASAWSEHSLDPDDIREELKKLYRQLEAHKTRRMAANNPHLSKKRSSRRSLGRSIVRRVAELPEAVARRSSGGERVGTPARRSSSAKWLPDAGGATPRMRDDGSRRRAATLRETRGTQGPVREPPGGSPTPGSPMLGRKTMAMTASEQSDSESLDAAPLVCKSASAHNLVGHGAPPRPCAAPLQKSLSVVAGAREEALLAASRAAREKWHANRHPSAPSSEPPTGQGPPKEAGKPQSPGAADALPPAGSIPAEGCPQEDMSPPGDGKVQKHVTYAPIKSVSVDSSHLPGRVRVAVRRTPPPPPVRYQSLVRREAPAGDSTEPAEPPPDTPARTGEPEGTQEGTQEGTAEEEPERASPPAGKGRLLTSVSIPAQVCPWELVQEEILRQKQKAAEAAESGTPGDAAATPPSLKPPSQKTSLRGLGLAIKAFSRARGKSTLKGKREGEGSLRKRGREREGGSRRERPSLAETSAVSLGAIGRDPVAKSPEWSRQRPGSEPTAHPWQGQMVSCQRNNNAGTAWEAAGWGYGREEAEGQRDSPALGMGDGEKLAEEPSAPQGDTDAGRSLGPPPGVHKTPLSVSHQEGAEHPRETPAVAGSRKAQIHPQGTEVPVAEPGKDAPAATVRLMAPKEGVAGLAEGLQRGSRSIRRQDHTEVEQPSAKLITGSPHPPTAGVRRVAAEKPGAEVCPWGAPGVPAGKGALLRQEAIASQEENGVMPGRESPAKALEKAGSQPEPLGPVGSRDTERVPAKSQSVDVGTASSTRSRQAGVCPGETQADPRIKIEICPWEESESERWGPGRAPGKGGSEGDPGYPREEPGTEKPPPKTPELPKAALKTAGSTEGRMAEVCPWESREGERATRAEICPWEVEEAPPEQEKQEGERRGLAKWVKSIRTKSLVLLRAQESGSSLQAASRPWGSTGSEGPPPKPAPRSSELPEVTSRSPRSSRASVCPWEVAGDDSDAEVCPWEKRTAFSNAGKLDDGEVSQVKNWVSPQRAAPRGTRETAPAADKGSSQRGSPSSREGAEQLGMGPMAKHPALPKTSPKQAGTTDSKKVSICPWEEEDQPLPKPEICPWEEPAAPSGKERPSQDTRGTSKGENKPGSRGLEDIKAKLAEMGGRQSERRDTSVFAKLLRKSLECSKAESKTSQSVESIKEEVCPWESLDTEQPPEKPRARSPALPKSPSKKSQSMDSLKAEICPWEVQELESTDKAEICPWEAAAPPSSKEKSRQEKDGRSTVSKSPSKSHGHHKEIGDSRAGKKEKASTDRESICPWESMDMDSPSTGYRAKSPELLKATTTKSESAGSMKAEVCPWESLGMEQSPEQPRARSPVLPKSPSKKSQSVESLKAEICPWEVQELESTDKAEICPWEAAAPPSSKEKSRQEKDSQSTVSKSPSKSHGLHKEIGDGRAGKKEKASTDRESICPWESTDMEGSSTGYRTKSPELLKAATMKSESAGSMKAEVCPWESLSMEQLPGKPRTGSPALPKSPSKKSQSVESLKAEICPWEVQEIECTDKAEICPWEMAAPPSDQAKAKQGPGGASKGDKRITRQAAIASPVRCLEKGSTERDAICPWESLGMDQTPEQTRARSPALPKSPSKKSQSMESLKAEICPWEFQEIEAGGKTEICPWESTDMDSPSTGYRTKSPELLKATTTKSESAGSMKAEVCPWESLGMEQLPGKPCARSPVLPKSPSKKSQSVESLKAEICPWEFQEIKAGGKMEICPWESMDMDSPSTGYRAKSPELLKATTTKSESTGSMKAEVCPWESLSMEQSPEQPRARSPVLPKSPSKKSQSVESLKAEICPWEFQEIEAGGKMEICPWESMDMEGSSTGYRTKSPELLKATTKKSESTGSMKAEVCPWESLSMEQLPGKPRTGSPVLPKSPSKKSQSVESLKAEICPWEFQEIESTDKAEICPWETAAPPSDQAKAKQGPGGASKGDKRITRQAAIASPVRCLEKGSTERDAICPWESLGMDQTPEQTRTRSPALPKSPSKKSQSVESLKAEICPWEFQEIEAGGKTEICPWESTDMKGSSTGYRTKSPELLKAATKKSESTGSMKAEVCPWESMSMEQLPGKPCARSPVLPKSPSKKSQSVESLKAEICPWEVQELVSSDKAEICPWENLRTAMQKEPSKKSDSTESRKSDICPWEAAEPTGLEKESFKPGMHPEGADRASPTGTGKSKPAAGASAVSPTALLKKFKGRSYGDAEHKPLCRMLPGIRSLWVPSAELLPWEVSMDSGPNPSGSIAEVCPWEAEEAPPASGKTSADTRKTSEVCPWEVESVDPSPTLHRQGRAGASPQDRGRGASEAQPDVCPWEDE